MLGAFALRSGPDPEVPRRQIRRTLEWAPRVPTEIAETASGIAIEAVNLAEQGNPNLRGDAFTADALAAAVARSAAELVRLNVELGDLSGDLTARATSPTGTYFRAAGGAVLARGGHDCGSRSAVLRARDEMTEACALACPCTRSCGRSVGWDARPWMTRSAWTA